MQLWLAVTPPNTSGTAAWQPAPALALFGAGQLTVGTVASVTVKVVVQVALLPVSSVAVTVIVFVPNPTSVPAAGGWKERRLGNPLRFRRSANPHKKFGTAAWQLPSALALVGAGQLTVGTVASVTVKVLGQVELLPASSVAVTVIVFVPNPTSVPAAGD